MCVKHSTKGRACNIDEAVWSPLWAKRQVHILGFLVHVSQLLHSLLFLCLFISLSSLSTPSLSAIVASPASARHAVKFCLNGLARLTDVCLFQMTFSIKLQPQQHSPLPPSPHLLPSSSSVSIMFEIADLSPKASFVKNVQKNSLPKETNETNESA